MLKTSSTSPPLVQKCVLLGPHGAGHSIPAGKAWLWGLFLCSVTRGVLEPADAQCQPRPCRRRGSVWSVAAPSSVWGALGGRSCAVGVTDCSRAGLWHKTLGYIDLVGYYDFFFFFPPFNCIIPLKNGGKWELCMLWSLFNLRFSLYNAQVITLTLLKTSSFTFTTNLDFSLLFWTFSLVWFCTGFSVVLLPLVSLRVRSVSVLYWGYFSST